MNTNTLCPPQPTSVADRQGQAATGQAGPGYPAIGLSPEFRNPRSSIDNAHRRIAEFAAISDAFSKTQPYSFVTKLDDDGVTKVYKIKLAEPMPRTLPGLAFDAVHSLRAALDQSAYACAVAANPKKSPVRAHFPFGESAARSTPSDSGGGLSRDIPRAIFDLLVSFQPYKGGDDLLWALNTLCNTETHKIVVPACVCVGGKMADAVDIHGPMTFFLPRWDRAKNEMLLARGTATFTHHNLRIATVIEMASADVVVGKPALGVLTYLHGRVTEIVDAIEAEALKIGLLTH